LKPTLLSNKDFWAGALLASIGVAAAVLARDYPFGTSLRMGPGYFPTVLGVTLALFGGYFLVRSLRASETVDSNWSLRALIGLTVSLILSAPTRQGATEVLRALAKVIDDSRPAEPAQAGAWHP